MEHATTSQGFRDGVTRREAMQYVATLMGGVALIGGDRALAFAPADGALAQAAAQGVGAFSAADVALLDEIAETILPETSTPGAKAARTGAFMALMVTDVYPDAEQQVFRQGMTALQDACRAMHRVGFMEATAVQRLAVLEVLDREQKTAMEERSAPLTTRYPAAAAPAQQPAHYFRMMKELALLGFFTSEIGYTKVMRYREVPGRFDPDVPYARGETIWAPHA
jgi:hypothetical protein